MVSYPQGQKGHDLTLSKCPSVPASMAPKHTTGTQQRVEGHIRDTSFNPCVPASTISVSNTSRPLEGHKGHMSTTYGHSSALIGLKSRNDAVENAIANQVSLVSLCDEFSTGGRHAH